jgi:hydroxyacylglutathione hydrolase
MRVARLVLGALETNCWVVGDDKGGPVVIIDPADDSQAILEAVDDREIALVVLTHGHFDHLGAVRELLETSAAPFAMHELDAVNVTTAEGTGGLLFGFDVSAPRPDTIIADGDALSAGELRLRVLHTPGHTPGGVCLLATDGAGLEHLFSGDTLFAGSVGRTDFPGGDARALSDSIARKLAPLAASTIIHPGHGPDTTIGRESRANIFWPRR